MGLLSYIVMVDYFVLYYSYYEVMVWDSGKCIDYYLYLIDLYEFLDYELVVSTNEFF